MPTPEGVKVIPDMHPDPRIRVFHRNFNGIEGFGSMEVDAYAVITRRYVVILDTLLCPEDAQFMIDSLQYDLNGRNLFVINSHADWDHCWGNACFAGITEVPIIGHDYEVVRMESAGAKAELDEYKGKYPLFHDVRLISPSLTFTNRLTIHGGDLTLQLFSAPGHHPDHIAAWIPELRLLLAFDAIEKPFPIIENAESAPSMFDTLEYFVSLRPERVLCSHGSVTDPRLIGENREYMREIERRCRALLQARIPTSGELEHAAELIDYSFDEAVRGVTEPIDRSFYSWAHEQNTRAILEWLIHTGGAAR